MPFAILHLLPSQANAIAKRLVLAAGFEVFEGAFAATLHAEPRWYDRASGQLEYDARKIEPTSDLITQLLINQICGAGGEEHQRGTARARRKRHS